jgi:hypothetical protein
MYRHDADNGSCATAYARRHDLGDRVSRGAPEEAGLRLRERAADRRRPMVVGETTLALEVRKVEVRDRWHLWERHAWMGCGFRGRPRAGPGADVV